MASSSAQHLDQVLDLERELQTAGCRADEARLRELLAPDFVEIGASGQRWDLDSILALLRQESSENDVEPIRPVGLTARELAPGVVQVFWDAQRGERHTRRTSLWCLRDGGWQQVYHQGTLLG